MHIAVWRPVRIRLSSFLASRKPARQPRFLSRPQPLQSLRLRGTFKPVLRERASGAPFIWSKSCPTEDESCIRTVRIVLRKTNHHGRRNRQDCRGNLASAQHPRRIVAHTTEEPGESKSPRLRLGHRLAGARRPDCDHAHEALLSNPVETRARKGDWRLVGLIVFPGENSTKA